ncbi:hypothetical protein [Nocardioides convexus]|uniref:hypothetical protein n=1 Tax=Nocardioides convexus TaxID=2712224 RepID=UPI00241863AF|nr:hypothetical protein [Nocardioides convexus]
MSLGKEPRGAWSTRCTATRWPAPSSGCGSSRSRPRRSRSLGLEPDGLVADYGPDLPVPVLEPPAEGEEPAEDAEPRTVPYVREEQVKRLRSAEKALNMLGRVNPLALEEFSAMEERHQFLSEQPGGPAPDPQGPARHRQGRRRPGGAGLHRGVRRRDQGLRPDLRPALPRR